MLLTGVSGPTKHEVVLSTGREVNTVHYIDKSNLKLDYTKESQPSILPKDATEFYRPKLILNRLKMCSLDAFIQR